MGTNWCDNVHPWLGQTPAQLGCWAEQSPPPIRPPDSVNVSIQNSIFKQGHCQPFQQFYIQFRFQNPGSIRNLQSLAQFYQHCSLNPLNKLWNRSKSLLFLLYFQRILDIMLIFRISSKHSPVEISHTLCFHFVSKNVKYSKLFKTCHHQITRNVKKNGGERRKWIHF